MNSDSLYLIGHPSCLLAGVTEGDVSYQQIKRLGNFGLGTFNGIPGEMVAIDGEFYLIGANGQTLIVDLNWQTPFAQVINFAPTTTLSIAEINNYQTLKNIFLAQFTNKNIPYALCVRGQFASLTLRSRSAKTPEEIQKGEPIYHANNLTGTLIGFWFPDYLMNLGIPGFHFHFITDDRKFSGHLLELQCGKVELQIQAANQIQLWLPYSAQFAAANIIMPTAEKYKQAQT